MHSLSFPPLPFESSPSGFLCSTDPGPPGWMIGVSEFAFRRCVARLSPFSAARLNQEIALWSDWNPRISKHGSCQNEAHTPTLSYQAEFRFRPPGNNRQRTSPSQALPRRLAAPKDTLPYRIVGGRRVIQQDTMRSERNTRLDDFAEPRYSDGQN